MASIVCEGLQVEEDDDVGQVGAQFDREVT